MYKQTPHHPIKPVPFHTRSVAFWNVTWWIKWSDVTHVWEKVVILLHKQSYAVKLVTQQRRRCDGNTLTQWGSHVSQLKPRTQKLRATECSTAVFHKCKTAIISRESEFLSWQRNQCLTALFCYSCGVSFLPWSTHDCSHGTLARPLPFTATILQINDLLPFCYITNWMILC
jgi:hypothetical protein